MKLKNTIGMMCSDDYKCRFKAEYYQLIIRYEKLKDMLEKWDCGTLKFAPTCAKDVYEDQIKGMTLYIESLEKRAEIENIEIHRI